jgi:acetyl esterase
MPLDPAAKNLLDVLVAAGRPKVWQISPVEAREGLRALAEAADAKDVPIGRIEDGTLPGPAGPLRYRSYTPRDAAREPLPGLVYFHGGGFVIGDLDTHDGLCRQLANASGCRVISVAYRLAPEYKFPAAIEDAYASASWVIAQAHEFGIDPERIAVGGDSAGGNLAAVVCQLAKERGSPKLALQLLLYPATESGVDTPSRLALAEGYLLEKRSIEWFFQHYVEPGTDPIDPRLSPLIATDVSGLPAAHIHTAEFDPLVDEGKAYADKLEAAGVEVEYTCHAGMIHHFFCLAGSIPYARRAIGDAGAAMKRALNQKTAVVPEAAKRQSGTHDHEFRNVS